MVSETLSFLIAAHAGDYIDATLGGGGHARALLRKLEDGARVFGIDADPAAIAHASHLLEDDSRFTAIHDRFSNLITATQSIVRNGVDGVLADLGVSSHQINAPERGFSFQQSGPLDLRMNRKAGESAAELLSRVDEQELASILWKFGEERRSRLLAKRILQAQRTSPIQTTERLAEIVGREAPGKWRVKTLARVFQALRIAVNDELGELQRFLPNAFSLLKPDGKLVIISYHSLEDRLVKNFFREKARTCVCPQDAPICTCNHIQEGEILTRRVVTPSPQEVQQNPRSRSAKLRAIKKLV